MEWLSRVSVRIHHRRPVEVNGQVEDAVLASAATMPSASPNGRRTAVSPTDKPLPLRRWASRAEMTLAEKL